MTQIRTPNDRAVPRRPARPADTLRPSGPPGTVRPPGPVPARPAVSIKLTGRGAVVMLFVATFFGLLLAAWTGWSALGDVIFLLACGAVTRYTRPSGLRIVVLSPPLTFFAGCVFAQVLTASGGFAIAEGILVTLATSAPWLFIGTGLTIAIALGRGWRPKLPARLTGDLRAAVRDVRPSRTSGNERWVRRRLAFAGG
jgi:uncharacterized protein DUF6542